MTFTKDDVETAAHEASDWYSFGWGKNNITINGETYETEAVANIGGEGEGSYRAVVFKIGDRNFRKEGYYESHYGTDWDGDFDEVQPYEKTVVDFKAV